MIQITVSNEGLNSLVNRLKNPGCQQTFVSAANRAIVKVQTLALIEVPKRTHQLMKSHLMRPALMSNLSAEVYTEKEYAVPVHEGHKIVAWGHPTGKFRPANPWLDRAAKLAEPTIESIFSKAADDVASFIVS